MVVMDKENDMEVKFNRWSGGVMPDELRGGVRVQVEFRNGDIHERASDEFRWDHKDFGDAGRAFDVVHYRVVKRPTTEQPEQKPHSHYHKDVSHLSSIDVYRVLDLFGVTDQAIGHAAKKLLVAGGRGLKDIDRDIDDVIDTLERWKEMRKEDSNG